MKPDSGISADRLTDSGKRREKYKAKGTEEQASEECAFSYSHSHWAPGVASRKVSVMFHKSPLRQEGAAPCVAQESSARVPESEDNPS